MKKITAKALSVLLCSSLLLSLASCGTKSENDAPQNENAGQENNAQADGTENGTPEQNDDSQGETTPEETEAYHFTPTASELAGADYDVRVRENRNEDGSKKYVLSDIAPTICYDNLSLGYLTPEATTYTLSLAEGVTIDDVSLSAVDESYASLSVEDLAVWDSESHTLTANSSATKNGVVFLDLIQGGEVVFTVNVRVTAAYPDDPGYDINAESIKDDELEFLFDYNADGELDENYNVHDPALTEAVIDGVRYYYMVQTGWAGGNILRRSTDLIHWEYLGKTTPAAEKMAEYGWAEVNDWMLTDPASCQYWAADLVPASYGGYWLYTCLVNSGYDDEKHDRVCIVLAWSPTLEARSFQYVGCILQSISDYAQDALYYNVVALDPQVAYDAAGNMYLTFGSFGAGTYMIELDSETGLRKDGETGWLDADTINTYMEEARATAIGETHPYYGTHMTYCAEGSVITHQYDVPIVSEDGEITEIYDDYYYLMTCLGVLSRNYVLFTAKSDTINAFSNLSGDPMASGWIGKELVTGLFPPLSGYRSDLDRESYITTADRIEGSTEYIAMSSFQWADYDFDIHAPGHGDLYTTSDGVNIAMLMVRTLALQSDKTAECDNGYPLAASSTKFFMQAHQYYINSVGDIVINANRYAGEPDRPISKEEFLSFANDNQFQLVLAGDPYVTTTAVYVTLGEDGSVTGDATGSWSMYGDRYIRLDIDGYDTYYGVVAVSWLDNKNCVGMTVTAMGQSTGCPLYMNSES
ncbi:MAG: glycoside hydrolase family 43 protein [Lachnospiraceae bacterium]|nr:glycoside hydrolase family 43 protein [Lachnospiraceae bacterium]MDE7238877.1 glycoside hydrolase family 43 protein [Lachnospiraceae bacterium]